MSKLVYTVEEDGKKQTYEGFCSCSPEFDNFQTPPKQANFLGIAQCEGDLELWWLEDRDESIQELQRYYRMYGCLERVIKVFTFA